MWEFILVSAREVCCIKDCGSCHHLVAEMLSVVGVNEVGLKFPGKAGQLLSVMLGRCSDACVKDPICQPAAIVWRIIRSFEAIVMLINEP